MSGLAAPSALTRRRLPAAVRLARRSFTTVIPRCDAELTRWSRRARSIPDSELRRQAVAAQRDKRFHVHGGAVFAAMAPADRTPDALIVVIVAVQTISDYLDNLCDRSTSLDPADFEALHGALTDAVTLDGGVGDYYRHRAERDDGGYLADLVRATQVGLQSLPGYAAVQPLVLEAAVRYGELQTHKHVRPDLRVARLVDWSARPLAQRHHDMRWWEFAAATGSTLGMFALFAAARDPGLTRQSAEAVHAAYFPWVSGLHILLDYLIDEHEDVVAGDLNFVAQYPSAPAAHAGLARFADRARRAVDQLDDPAPHRLVLAGLIGMYLSDPKLSDLPHHRRFARRLTVRTGAVAVLFRWVCRYYRRTTASE